MVDSNEFNNIITEITISYESKVKNVTSLMKQVCNKIKNYHTEQEIMINRLKNILAKNAFLRKKDFDNIISDIRKKQIANEKEITKVVDEFCNEEEDKVSKLKEIFNVKNKTILEDFEEIKKRLLVQPKKREREICRILKDFHHEQEELNIAIQMLMGKGNSIKVKDFKAMIKAFSIEHDNFNVEIDKILEQFEDVKDDIRNKWLNVTSIAR